MCFPGKRDDFVCHYIYFGPGFLCLSFSLYPLVSGGVVLPLVFSFFAYTLTFTSEKVQKRTWVYISLRLSFGQSFLEATSFSLAHQKALKAPPSLLLNFSMKPNMKYFPDLSKGCREVSFLLLPPMSNLITTKWSD